MIKNLFFLLASVSLYSFSSDPRTVQEEIEHRWNAFQERLQFAPFKAGRNSEGLLEEFCEIEKTRKSIWETPCFERAEHLLVGDFVRAPGCSAFDYNNVALNFNASWILLGGERYIACEGPRSKDIPNFFRMLQREKVTHLVRLTDSYEGETKKCHPYWDGLLASAADGSQLLEIPTEQGTYPVHAYNLDHWRDNQGIDPKELLEFVLEVRESWRKKPGLMAVHCSAGVGRTGTFLASLAILDAIDRGEPFSIEEIVYRLSLQRVYSVGRGAQYVTLHRLAEIYAESKAPGSPRG